MFCITAGKGFQITFENGWTASVQFGYGNYCCNRYINAVEDGCESPDAEVAAWGCVEDKTGEVNGWQSPKEVLAFLSDVAARPPKPVAAPQPDEVQNMDCMTLSDLILCRMDLAEKYGALHPLTGYAANKIMAIIYRDRDNIVKALEFDAICDKIYDGLPANQRW